MPHYEAMLETNYLVNHSVPLGNYRQYYSCGGAFATAHWSNAHTLENGRNMLIEGCSWGKVAIRQIYPDFWWGYDRVNVGDDDDDDEKAWRECLFYFYRTLFLWIGTTSIEDWAAALEIWRTILGDRFPEPSILINNTFPCNRISKHEATEKSFLHCLQQAHEHENNLYRNQLLRLTNGLLREHAVCITDLKDLIRTRDTVKEGDEVFVARGCSVALILRPTSEEKARQAVREDSKSNLDLKVRELVAAAYVNGIMDGEAIQKVNDGEIKEEYLLLV